jgi:hypothetical protein
MIDDVEKHEVLVDGFGGGVGGNSEGVGRGK